MLQLTRRKRRHLDMVPPTQSNPADVTARPLMPLGGLASDARTHRWFADQVLAELAAEPIKVAKDPGTGQ